MNRIDDRESQNVASISIFFGNAHLGSHVIRTPLNFNTSKTVLDAFSYYEARIFSSSFVVGVISNSITDSSKLVLEVQNDWPTAKLDYRKSHRRTTWFSL